MLFIFYDVSQSKAQDFAKKKMWLAFYYVDFHLEIWLDFLNLHSFSFC